MSRGTYIPPKKGQKTMAESSPVVLSSDQAAIPITVASVPSHAVTNAGTFAVQVDGAALTSLQLIDDAIYTDGSGTVTKGVAILGQDGTNPQAVKTDSTGRVEVIDGGQSITVDAPVATPVFVRLSDGASAISTLPVSAASLPLPSNAAKETGGNLDTIVTNQTTELSSLAAMRTSLELIDDTVYTKDAPTMTKGVGMLGYDGANLRALKTNASGEIYIGSIAAGTNAIGKLAANSGVDIGDVDVTTLPTTTEKEYYATDVSLTVTNLHSLASSSTAGWQSDRVSNISTKATDFLILAKIVMANTVPGSDKAVYLFLVPWYTTDGGTTWYANSQGTTTLPTGTQGTTTIAEPFDLIPLGRLAYTTQNMVLQGSFLLSNVFGNNMPHGFSIILKNFSGAAVHSSGSIIEYCPINKQSV